MFRTHVEANQAAAADVNDIELKEIGKGEDSVPDVKVTQHQCRRKKPRLFWAMFKTFWFRSFIAAVYKFIFDVLQFVSPLILK